MTMKLIIVSLFLQAGAIDAAFAKSDKSADKATQEAIDAKIASWKDQFMKDCTVKAKSVSKKANALKICECVVTRHRTYILKKSKGEDPVNVEAHLKQLLDVYAARDIGQTKAADNFEPDMTDLDMDLSATCFNKK